MSYKIIDYDPVLKYFEGDINLRMDNYHNKRRELVGDAENLLDFSNAYNYFGFHRTKTGWVYREWAPGASKMYLTGDFNNWELRGCPMKKRKNGVFEVELEGRNALKIGQKVQAIIIHDRKMLRRIPLFATRVEQDPKDYTWCAVIDDTYSKFKWTDKKFRPDKTPFIYECHIGMAQSEPKVGSYREFKDNILPRIQKLGYNTIQIMAIMEHPYYGSFGYQVSNFFASSSRYGDAEDLKDLINTAHEMGIAVLLDVVHSHAVRNTSEGINQFDGTDTQFFHAGDRGDHLHWNTKVFNYGKNEVIHFLLSNLKYWMDVFHFDGFRFDGVTSMLYKDHGIGTNFDMYEAYFSTNTDTDAVTYLQLANELVHEINPNAITIAEDMSGMPGMCIPIEEGGVGFDYRLSMGMPDFWIKTIRDKSDEDWDLGKMWWELNIRRKHEKNIGYAESHDQALVGDKTIMFRLCDAEMYTGMSKFDPKSIMIDRGISLHKMIRLITASTSGEGYLNFMGNEFGHPEWIDFPREGNGWSHHYCRRQWYLADDHDLWYHDLNEFDEAMIHMLKEHDVLGQPEGFLMMNHPDKVLSYKKNDLVFVFNFHPVKCYSDYELPMPEEGEYKVLLTTESKKFGGDGRVAEDIVYNSQRQNDGRTGFMCYIPNRSAIVFQKVNEEPDSKAKATSKKKSK